MYFKLKIFVFLTVFAPVFCQETNEISYIDSHEKDEFYLKKNYYNRSEYCFEKLADQTSK